MDKAITLTSFGWAPGYYTGKCHECHDDILGAKRSWNCQACATDKAKRNGGLRIRLKSTHGVHEAGSEHFVAYIVPHGGYSDDALQYVLPDGTHVIESNAEVLNPAPAAGDKKTHVDGEVLEPCPFDKGAAVLSERSGDERSGYNVTYKISCTSCGATMTGQSKKDSKGWVNDPKLKGRAELIAKWNKRAN